MSAPSEHSRRNHLVFAFALALLIGGAMAFGQDLVAGALGFGIVFGWAVVTCFVSPGRFELLRVGPKDERQEGLNLEAMSVAGAATMLAALIGAVWDLAHDRVGAYAVICVVSGLAFLVAQLTLPRVR